MPYTPGPFNQNHLYLQFGGKLPGNEDWSCGIRLAGTGVGVTEAMSDAILAGMDVGAFLETHAAPKVLAYFTDGNLSLSASALLTFAKLNLILRTGHYDSLNSHEHVFANVNGAGGANNRPPNQVALAVSLTTGFDRGPAHRGRFYLPLPAGLVDSAGLWPANLAVSAAAATKTFLEALSDVPGIDLPGSPGAVVMSRKAGSPACRRVTGVEVGRVLDTQRRRRRSLPETYQSNTVDQGLL